MELRTTCENCKTSRWNQSLNIPVRARQRKIKFVQTKKVSKDI